MSTPEKLMEPSELAELLGISEDEVKRRSSAGEFPHVRIGRKYRYSAAHFEAIVATHSKDAKTTAANPWGRRTRGKAAS